MTVFGTLRPDGTLSNMRVIKQSDILACPHCILHADHYREDGSCRCDDATHTEMADWGYEWDGFGWVSGEEDEEE